MSFLAILLCVMIIAACTANPIKNAIPKEDNKLYGNYVFEQQIYMNPLSSFIALDGYKEYYTFMENSLILTDESGNQQKIAVAYENGEVDEQEFKNSFIMGSLGVPNIAGYKERYQYTVTCASGYAVYRIYRLDDEIWLARIRQDTANTQKNEYIWNIYKINKFEGEIPIKATITGTQDGVEDFYLCNRI